ncbi:MAG: hypothetical protein D3909_17675 [Candidatus Electrothrix sp. ATG1]|nr:hypothetical protein [Candidatus Electrothrix sp. ATG1]MCI5210427.1 hypothetical protein [Candidatus Electrothrix sp. ATG2]
MKVYLSPPGGTTKYESWDVQREVMESLLCGCCRLQGLVKRSFFASCPVKEQDILCHRQLN